MEELYQSHVHDSSFEHMVQPKMVYISNPTEYGTLYSRKELEELSRVCREHDLYLFMDGARLGYGWLRLIMNWISLFWQSIVMSLYRRN